MTDHGGKTTHLIYGTLKHYNRVNRSLSLYQNENTKYVIRIEI